jgi:CBS domain containing-hemolysin-like protein
LSIASSIRSRSVSWLSPNSRVRRPRHIEPLDGGGWEADARAELEDVGETVDPRLAEVEEDVDTLGGLAFVLAGHVPEAGECLPHDSGWTLEVIEADARKVTKLRLHPPAELAEPEE